MHNKNNQDLHQEEGSNQVQIPSAGPVQRPGHQDINPAVIPGSIPALEPDPTNLGPDQEEKDALLADASQSSFSDAVGDDAARDDAVDEAKDDKIDHHDTESSSSSSLTYLSYAIAVLHTWSIRGASVATSIDLATYLGAPTYLGVPNYYSIASTLNTGLGYALPVALGTLALGGVIDAIKAADDDTTEDRGFTIGEGLSRAGLGSTAFCISVGVLAANPITLPLLFAGIVLGMVKKEDRQLEIIRKKKKSLEDEITALRAELASYPEEKQDQKHNPEEKRGEAALAAAHPEHEADQHKAAHAGPAGNPADAKARHSFRRASSQSFVGRMPLSKRQRLEATIAAKETELQILEIQERSVEKSRNALLLVGALCVGLLLTTVLFFPPVSIPALVLSAVAVTSFALVSKYIAHVKANAAKDIAAIKEEQPAATRPHWDSRWPSLFGRSESHANLPASSSRAESVRDDDILVEEGGFSRSASIVGV